MRENDLRRGMNCWNFVAEKVEKGWAVLSVSGSFASLRMTAKTKTERQTQIPPLGCGMTTREQSKSEEQATARAKAHAGVLPRRLAQGSE
jgi:hypothetical protein